MSHSDNLGDEIFFFIMMMILVVRGTEEWEFTALAYGIVVVGVTLGRNPDWNHGNVEGVPSRTY